MKWWRRMHPSTISHKVEKILPAVLWNLMKNAKQVSTPLIGIHYNYSCLLWMLFYRTKCASIELDKIVFFKAWFILVQWTQI